MLPPHVPAAQAPGWPGAVWMMPGGAGYIWGARARTVSEAQGPASGRILPQCSAWSSPRGPMMVVLDDELDDVDLVRPKMGCFGPLLAFLSARPYASSMSLRITSRSCRRAALCSFSVLTAGCDEMCTDSPLPSCTTARHSGFTGLRER